MIPLELQRARHLLSTERPFITHAIFSLTPVKREGMGTMAVDRYWRLYFDPDILREWGKKTTSAVLYHEVWHLLRQHFRRLKSFPEKIANVAADLEINDDKDDIFDDLPEGVLYPWNFGLPSGKLAEFYASRLQPDVEVLRPSGSAATGRPAPWELPPPEDWDEMKDEAIAQRVARDILSGRGDVPGNLLRWAEKTIGHDVIWKRELSAFIGSYIRMDDYSFLRPSRRFRDVILPSLRTRKPKVAVVLDTSGSISKEGLSTAVSEVSAIAKASGAVDVLICDADVHSIVRYTEGSDLKLSGGGGTDMAMGIERALELSPDVIIVLTDGLTPWPSERPSVPVIICLIGERTGEAPDWAKTIRIPGGGR